MNYSKLLGLIREKGYTQVELASKIGISSVTINKKLRGHSDFTQSEIASICKVLEITDADIPAYFFTPKLKFS